MLADVLQQRLSILQAVLAVTLLGILGIFALLILWLARRRFMLHRRSGKPARPVPDIWRESGRRLLQQLDHPPAPGTPGSPETPSPDQDPPLRRPTFLDDLDNLPPDPPDPPESDRPGPLGKNG